jgi:hypothetical protein
VNRPALLIPTTATARCTVVDLVLSPDERRLCEDGFRRGRTAAGQIEDAGVSRLCMVLCGFFKRDLGRSDVGRRPIEPPRRGIAAPMVGGRNPNQSLDLRSGRPKGVHAAGHTECLRGLSSARPA